MAALGPTSEPTLRGLENLHQNLAGTLSPLIGPRKTSLKAPIINEQELSPWHRLLVLSGPAFSLLMAREAACLAWGGR